MIILNTERLRLLPLTNQLLQTYLISRSSMEQELGLNPSSMKIDPLYQEELQDALVNYWLPQTAAHADIFYWYTNWEIILRSTNTSIGGIGFLGYPDENGETEIGFMLDGHHHGKGLALEALRAMVEWAFNNRDIRRIRARTFEDNLPARKLLRNAGFEQTELVDNLLVFIIQSNR